MECLRRPLEGIRGKLDLLIDYQECKDPQDDRNWFVGVWRPANGASGGYALYRFSTWKDFTDNWKEQSKGNLRLIDVSDGPEGDSSIFVGVYRGGSDPHYLYRKSSWSAVVDKWKELREQGLRLVDFDESRRGNNTWFTGVWRKGAGGEALYRYDNWDAFVSRWNDLANKNYRLMDMGVSRSGGKTWFSGVWRAGAGGGYALHRFDSWSGILNKWLEIDNNGNSFAKLRDIECWQEGGKLHYVGVWY